MSVNMDMVTYSALYGTYSAYDQAFGTATLLGTKVEKIFNAHRVGTVDGYGYNYHYWTYIGSKAALTDEEVARQINALMETLPQKGADACEEELRRLVCRWPGCTALPGHNGQRRAILCQNTDRIAVTSRPGDTFLRMYGHPVLFHDVTTECPD